MNLWRNNSELYYNGNMDWNMDISEIIVLIAPSNAFNLSLGFPWFMQNTLSYFPANAFPKLSSNRELDLTIIGH